MHERTEIFFRFILCSKIILLWNISFCLNFIRVENFRTLTREGSEVSAPTTSTTVTTSSTNKSTAAAAVAQSTTATKTTSSKEKDKEQAQRTIITLMGGRGYIQWQGGSTVPGQQQQINNNNAHLVIWDYKVWKSDNFF